MRLTTWNVNGIRNPFSYQPWNTARTFPAMFDILGSDIVVMQELKIQRKDLRDDMVLLDDWDCFFSLPKHKKGYSGVGIYTRKSSCAPIRAEEGILGVLQSPSGVNYRELPSEESIGGYPSEKQIFELGVDPSALDSEGRCVVLEFPAFVLFGVYSPANSNGLRDDFRYGFICALDCRIRNLIHAGKNVVLVGDLNVSRGALDSAGAADDIRKASLTHDEYISTPNRRIFNQLLVGGDVIGDRDEGREVGVLWDTTRGFHPDRVGMYTHWEQKINARPGNYGSRIDFVLVAEAMQQWIADANIQEGLLGSDHCPVFADFKEKFTLKDSEIHLLDIMNPRGAFVDGRRLQAYNPSHSPAFSAKRLPEFEKRRSIKSMFAAPAVVKSKPPQQEPNKDLKEEASAATTTSVISAQQRDQNDGFRSSQLNSRPSLSPVKRRATSGSSTKEVPSKRQKSESQNTTSNGQQSLKGFFQSQSRPDSARSRTASSDQSSKSDTRRPVASREGRGQATIDEVSKFIDGKAALDGTNEQEPEDTLSEGYIGAAVASQRAATLDSKDIEKQVLDENVSPAQPMRLALSGNPLHSPESTQASQGRRNNLEPDDQPTYDDLVHTPVKAVPILRPNGNPPNQTESPRSATEFGLSPSKESEQEGSPSAHSAHSESAANIPKRLHTSAKWSELFTRPNAPLCEGHEESCKTMLTKKKGSNQGRSFWMCARPLGPSGQKEKGTEWRCGTFIWATDWKGG